MQEVKCIKCGVGLNERFQRGDSISGTRCMACHYETFAKVCKSVGEIRQFLEKFSDGAMLHFEDEQANVTLEAHYTGEIATSMKVKVWKGSEK